MLSNLSFYIIQSLNASALLLWTSKRARTLSQSQKIALDIGMLTLISGLVGARAAHIFFEQPALYWQQPSLIMRLDLGGYVYFGGFFAALATVSAYIKLYLKQSFRAWLDFFAPIVSLGTAIGRLGCFVAGCCYGKYCELPWAISGRHPTQLYLLLSELCVFAALILAEKKKFLKNPGDVFLLWICTYSAIRLFIENWRDDFRGPSIFEISISQFISATILLVSLAFILSRHFLHRQMKKS
jgi:phosphatidylglycerol---prolipoprotein diacylglyceryl transferase